MAALKTQQKEQAEALSTAEAKLEEERHAIEALRSENEALLSAKETAHSEAKEKGGAAEKLVQRAAELEKEIAALKEEQEQALKKRMGISS